MTLAQYLRIIRQQWLLVMVLTLVCLGLASAYTFTRTPQYSASTQMFVKVRDNNASITQLTQGSDFTQARVKSYADVVTAPFVLNRVITELGLSTTASRLADNVAVEIPPDTVLINVTVRDPSPQRAADIANSISTAFPLFVKELETPNGTSENSPVTVTVTAPATPPGAPISPRVPLNLALGLLLGLGLGIGAAILRKQANTTVSGVADVERITGSIPLGVVPFDANTAKQPLVDADQHSPGPRPSAPSEPTSSSRTSTTRPRSSSSPRRCRPRARAPRPATSRSRWPRRARAWCWWTVTCACRRSGATWASTARSG